MYKRQLLLQIVLVHQRNGRPPGAQLRQLLILFGGGGGAVEYRQHQPGLLQLAAAAADALGLHHIAGLPQACGIKQIHPHAAQHHRLLHQDVYKRQC